MAGEIIHGNGLTIFLLNYSSNRPGISNIEYVITALEATTTLTDLYVHFSCFECKPENHRRRVIEPLCRCIANLRRQNPNHRLRTLTIIGAMDDVDQFLVAAKQLGIHRLNIYKSRLPIQSLVKFCRDNTELKVLNTLGLTLFDNDSTISVSQQDEPQDAFSGVLALDELLMRDVLIVSSSAVTKFLNFIAQHVTYPLLGLGKIKVRDYAYNREKRKIARLRIVSALIIHPSVEQLTLHGGCRIEVMEVMEECTTALPVQLDADYPPFDFRSEEVQQKLQGIVTRNHTLARFVANPGEYRGDELMALLIQFDNNPTGRYMLARCFPEIPSFFKIMVTDPPTAGPKKRKRCY